MSQDNINKMLQAVLTTAADVTTYTPTEDQRKAKSAFWTSISEEGIVPPTEGITEPLVAQFVHDTRLPAWWSIPGFQQWFTNNQEFTQRVGFIADLALDEMENIIRSNLVTAQVKTPLIKLAMEMAGKIPKNRAQDTESEEDVISKMSRAELEEYIAKKMPMLVPTTK